MPLPPDTPPPVGPRGMALRAAVQGQDARAAGAPVLACPYDATRPFSRRAWVVGYNADNDPGEAIGEDVDDGAPAPPTA